MPDDLMGPDAVAAYRSYYIREKSRVATWKPPSARPDWMIAA
jgi:hypothetical protein